MKEVVIYRQKSYSKDFTILSISNSFQCIENLSRTNCPVCMEDIHTSREPSQIPPCHHLIHKSCFYELTVTHNKLVCPICNKSLYHQDEIQPLWDYYDKEIENMPMSYPYEVINHSL